MKVVDLMSTDVVTVTPDTGIREAARLMVRHRVSGLPVVEDRLVGIITEADFLRLEVERQERFRAVETVAEVMSGDVVTIAPEATLHEAAKLMADRDVKRLPVVDDEGRLLGVISRSDVVTVFTRPDDVIEDEIREDLLRRVLFVAPDTIDVSVDNGVVVLAGEIGTRTEARLLEELTRRLDGVLRVENRLRWRLDDVDAEGDR
ncbi:MAG TPA: CBS domain-containing protein [Actinobacteria bacterium]|nr:CBS domain-containing protein [Actinomycetota bacterium]